MKKNLSLFFVLLGLGLVVFFFRLGSLPLMDPDEPRYAQAAREMMESGDWINPRLNQEHRWDKPVLFYWLILWSYWVLGVSEWSARLPSALFAILSLFLIFFWSYRNRDRQVGWLSALVLATHVEFCIVGRLAITDMSLSFFESLALVVAFESWRSNGRFIIFAYIACALAFLTKGPIGLLLPGLIFFVFLLVSRNLGFLRQARLGSGLAVFALLAFPWYLIEGLLYKDFFQYFFVLHNVKRFATEALRHTEPPFYYLGVIAAGFFPWSVFLPRALWRTIRIYWKEPFYLFLGIWVLVEFAFFTFSKAKLPTYILSMFLPLSLLVGRTWYDLIAGGEKANLRLEGLVIALVSLGGIIAGGYFWFQVFPGSLVPFLWTSLPTLMGFIFVSVLSFVAKPSQVFKAIVASFLIGFLTFTQFLGAGLGRARSLKDLSLEIKSRMAGAVRVGSFELFKPSLVFYLGRRVEPLKKIEELESLMRGSSLAFCVMRKETYLDLEKGPLSQDLILIKDVQGKVLVTNQAPSNSSERS